MARIYFWIIIAFAVIGCVELGIILHELNHQWYFNGIAQNGSICLLEYPSFDEVQKNKNIWKMYHTLKQK